MRRYRVRLTPEAKEDLLRPYDFLLERDLGAAERALRANEEGFRLPSFTPFSCRKAVRDNPLRKELIIASGSAAHVALFEIDARDSVTILAVRRQRADDFH